MFPRRANVAGNTTSSIDHCEMDTVCNQAGYNVPSIGRHTKEYGLGFQGG